jgi:hypothetical protein
MTQHTPAPWRAVQATGKNSGTLRRDIVSDGTPFSPSFVAGDVLENDAELIANAPITAMRLEAAEKSLAMDVEVIKHLTASRAELLSVLQGLFENCAMIHKHWGDASNAAAADEAIKAAQAAIAKATNI